MACTVLKSCRLPSNFCCLPHSNFRKVLRKNTQPCTNSFWEHCILAEWPEGIFGYYSGLPAFSAIWLQFNVPDYFWRTFSLRRGCFLLKRFWIESVREVDHSDQSHSPRRRRRRKRRRRRGRRRCFGRRRPPRRRCHNRCPSWPLPPRRRWRDSRRLHEGDSKLSSLL